MSKSKLWRKGFIWFMVPDHCSIILQKQDGNSNMAETQRQNLMQRPQSDNYWLFSPMACSAFILAETRTTNPSIVTKRWFLPHQSLIKNVSYNWIFWSHFFKWVSLHSDDSSLWHKSSQYTWEVWPASSQSNQDEVNPQCPSTWVIKSYITWDFRVTYYSALLL